MAIDWPPAVVYPILAAGGIALAGLLLRGIRWTIAQITEDVVDTLDGRLGLNNLRAAVATIQRELRPNTGEVGGHTGKVSHITRHLSIPPPAALAFSREREKPMFTSTFWKDAAERAVKTAAQAALLALGGDMIDVFAGLALWQTIGGAAAGGALLSILTSVATAASTGDDESASFVASPESS